MSRAKRREVGKVGRHLESRLCYSKKYSPRPCSNKAYHYSLFLQPTLVNMNTCTYTRFDVTTNTV